MGDHTIVVSGSWWYFLYSSSVYSCHLFLIASASVRSIPFLSFLVPTFIIHFFMIIIALRIGRQSECSKSGSFPTWSFSNLCSGLTPLSPAISFPMCEPSSSGAVRYREASWGRGPGSALGLHILGVGTGAGVREGGAWPKKGSWECVSQVWKTH